MAVSILFVAAIYLALNLSLLSALDMAALRASDLPAALVIENAFGRSGGVLVALRAIVIVVVAINAIVMCSARILYGLARDGLFLPVATKVTKGGTPHIALAITAAAAVPLIFSGAFAFLFKLTAALAIFAFFLYELSAFVLRRRSDERRVHGRAYRGVHTRRHCPAPPLFAEKIANSVEALPLALKS